MTLITTLRARLETGEPNAALARRRQAQVKAIETRYDIVLPSDFRDYLIGASPDDGEQEVWDDDDILWWPIGRIKSIPDEYQTPIDNERIRRTAGKYLFFADFMIWCWAWAICCDKDGDYGKIVVIGDPDRFVARNFTDFVSRISQDPRSVDPMGAADTFMR